MNSVKITIFIVEDDLSLQLLYKKILVLNGFEVIATANNGEEAISMYKSFLEKPDIILMDHRMPIKNGIEALREILQLDNHSRIIFASADNTVKEEALSVKMGADRLEDYLQHKAEVITGTDMSCLMHLEGIVKQRKLRLEVKHFSEILIGS